MRQLSLKRQSVRSVTQMPLWEFPSIVDGTSQLKLSKKIKQVLTERSEREKERERAQDENKILIDSVTGIGVNV